MLAERNDWADVVVFDQGYNFGVEWPTRPRRMPKIPTKQIWKKGMQKAANIYGV